jgi:predicted nucleic acid-binding protein
VILVDTSVWIDHLRSGLPALGELLQTNRVATHPLIIGELACVNLKNRSELINLWQSLVTLPEASHEEALYFIEKNQLMGKGIGYIDVQLLAAVVLSGGARIWTKDKRLQAIAGQKGWAWKQGGS